MWANECTTFFHRLSLCLFLTRTFCAARRLAVNATTCSAASATARSSVATFAPPCELKSEAKSSQPPAAAGRSEWVTRVSDRADAGGINSKLGLVPKWQAIANDLNPACIGWHWEIHVCKAHASGDRVWPTRRQLARAGGRGKNPMYGKHTGRNIWRTS